MNVIKSTILPRLLEETQPDDDGYAYQSSLYTSAQEIVLLITPYFTAPLSILGSGLILYVIYKERQTKLKETYHRLMLGLSLLNFINSLSLIVMSHWSMPAYTGLPGAVGTTTTCTIQGFLLNLIFGSMTYSFFLCLCFCLRIQCECKTKCIARWAETIGHFFGFIFPILGGSYAAAEGHINPMEQLPGWCWTTDYPNGCGENDNVDCIRGQGYEETADAATIIMLFCGIIICMVLIICKVRRTEVRIRAYDHSGNRRSLVRTKQAGVQALWYIGVFFLVYFPIAVLMGLGDDYSKYSSGLYFSFSFLTKLLAPLQGFFNALIYFRRNFRTLLQEGRTLSSLSHLFETLRLSHGATTTTTTTSNQVAGATSNAGNAGVAMSGMEQGGVVAQSDENKPTGNDTDAMEAADDVDASAVEEAAVSAQGMEQADGSAADDP